VASAYFCRVTKKLKDKLQLLRKTTARRSWNAIKVITSFYWSRLSGRPVQKGMPMAIALEPTTACNLSCPECPSGLKSFSRPTGNLKEEVYRAIIDQTYKDTFYLTFYFQGEPFINPRFLEMVKYASEKRMYTATSTNAHFLNDENARKTIESGLDRLIISIDGTSQETYESYRKGGKLEKVIEGTRNMVKWKKQLGSSTPHLIFQFLVVKPNEHQIEEVHRLAKELGVDEVRLKTAQLYDYKNGNPLMPENEKYSRYIRKKDGSYTIKNRLENHCWKLWHSCVVTWDGRVIPCCFDKDAEYQLGDLQQHSFEEIWQGNAYQSFRSSLFKGRDQIEICKNCSEGTQVWAS
jgi:radical SAM protein with 4Fe4S-binding SPASM domain